LELAHAVVTNGGRAALFGRTIFDDDNPRAIVRALRAVLDQEMSVNEAFALYQKAE
jgi:DhnA family fructose-bisphosphate aldolase class Ia